jgi:hypothetical protein
VRDLNCCHGYTDYITQIDLLNHHNFASRDMVDSSYARSGAEACMAIVDGLDVAPTSDAFSAVQEKFREKMVLL